MKKVCICLFCVLCMLHTYTFATSINDCSWYSAVTQDWYIAGANNLTNTAWDQVALAYFTDKDLWVIYTHFRQFCCIDQLASDGCEDQPWEKQFAMSPFIADHLINIGFRKLDGVETHCKKLWHDCVNRTGVPDLSVAWREKITEIAEDRAWYPPILIEKTFHEYWWDTEANDKAIAAIHKKDRAGVNTLRAQYLHICEEITALQQYLDPQTWSETDYIQATNGEWLERHCKQLANQRYLDEVKYVRTLMVEKWVKYLIQNLEAYSLDYMIDNRFNDLSDKYTNLEACFSTVLSYSTNTACCNE